MITEIYIENYKSIHTLKMNLGRVNVFIGENGCGKSNILEAIALASAAASNKLDNEFLAPRGIRVVEPQFMRSAFEEENLLKEIKINFNGKNDLDISYVLNHDNQPYSKWIKSFSTSREDVPFHIVLEEIKEEIPDFLLQIQDQSSQQSIQDRLNTLRKVSDHRSHIHLLTKIVEDTLEYIPIQLNLINFLVYSPENTALRGFNEEGQILPLGIKGEGLFKLLKILSADKNLNQINEIREKLKLLDWFDDFEIPQGLYESERKIQIKDRYLDDTLPFFDQRSSNEGFLFLLFYFTLFISSYTPKFFAIDNIDASLNPKLCTRLIKELVELAKKHDKQVIFTTHNPAILDGLNLGDDEQRLFAIYRNKSGHTKAERVRKPEPQEGEEPIRLSEAFMRGYIGALPKNF